VTEQAGATEAETRADVVRVVHLELFDEPGEHRLAHWDGAAVEVVGQLLP
jgi:hypothetical protein